MNKETYTTEQIEDQMRIMNGLIVGDRELGTPDTLVGQMPTDSGAKWQYAGTADDGKPILTQITVQPNSDLQRYILANSGSAQNGVPNIVYDQLGKSGSSSSLTGPFTKFDPSDANYVKNTTADAASAVSSNAGRLGAIAATGAALRAPLAPAFETIAFGSTVAGCSADFVAQMVRPNPGSYVAGSVVDVTLGGTANKYPLAGTFFTELGNWIKNTGTFNDVSNKLNEAVQKRK